MGNMIINNTTEIEEKVAVHEGIIGEDFQKIESMIEKYGGAKSSLIAILLEIQTEYNYLPREILIIVAKKLNIPLIKIYSVATFYKVFSLKPRGKHILSICIGTACHVRGGIIVADKIQRELNIKPGETTEDMVFTLETVRCLGCCASGPIIVVDNEYYSLVTPKKLDGILDKYRTANSNLLGGSN